MVEKKKGPQRGKKKDDAPSEEPVLVWSINGAPGIDETYIGTEDEAESVRADYEGAKGGPIAKQLADKLLATLRAAGKPMTVAELHTEIVADIPEGAEGYVPQGKVDAIVRNWLLPTGLATQEGEAFVPVPPATLAKRRAELLAQVAIEPMDIDVESNVQRCDAEALQRAGLAALATSEDVDDPDLSLTGEQFESLIQRGAYASVIEAIAECRPAGGGTLITDADAGQERAAREKAEKDLELVKGQRERLRAYLRERGVNTHLIEEPPAVSAPVKAVEGDRRDTWTKVIELDDVGLADVARELLAINREEERLKSRIESAKEAHAEHISGIKAQLGKLSDRKREIEREDETGKRTLTREAIVRIDWGADEEVWLAVDTGEELERTPIKKGSQRTIPGAEKSKAEETPKAAPATPQGSSSAPAGDSMTVLPASEAAAAAAAQDTAPEAPPEPPPVPSAPKPKGSKAPLTPEGIGGVLVEIVAPFTSDDELSLRVATEKVAERLGIADPPPSLSQLVKVAARKGHEKNLFRWWVGNGDEWIAKRAATAQPVLDGVAAAAGALADETAKAIDILRSAGAEGLTRKDLAEKSGLDVAAIDALVNAGVVARNGKRGLGARLVAPEFAPKANGAAAEAQA